MYRISALRNFTLALSGDILFVASIMEFAFVNPDHHSPVIVRMTKRLLYLNFWHKFIMNQPCFSYYTL